MPHWTVYTRAGCTLCESLMVELAELLGPHDAAAVEVVDIADDAELSARYGSKIPVLLADGDFVCCYHLDRERVRAHLAA
jgi:hypothetical protein